MAFNNSSLSVLAQVCLLCLELVLDFVDQRRSGQSFRQNYCSRLVRF